MGGCPGGGYVVIWMLWCGGIVVSLGGYCMDSYVIDFWMFWVLLDVVWVLVVLTMVYCFCICWGLLVNVLCVLRQCLLLFCLLRLLCLVLWICLLFVVFKLVVIVLHIYFVLLFAFVMFILFDYRFSLVNCGFC